MRTQKRKPFNSTWKEYADSAGSMSITRHDGINGAGRRAEGDEYPAILKSLGHNSVLGSGVEQVTPGTVSGG